MSLYDLLLDYLTYSIVCLLRERGRETTSFNDAQASVSLQTSSFCQNVMRRLSWLAGSSTCRWERPPMLMNSRLIAGFLVVNYCARHRWWVITRQCFWAEFSAELHNLTTKVCADLSSKHPVSKNNDLFFGARQKNKRKTGRRRSRAHHMAFFSDVKMLNRTENLTLELGLAALICCFYGDGARSQEHWKRCRWQCQT